MQENKSSQKGGRLHHGAYDTVLYPFRESVERYLEYCDLEHIHNDHRFSGLLTNAAGKHSDQGQFLHRKFYDGMDRDSIFKPMYDSLIQDVVAPIFNEPILFQKFPTFRIHQPNNICVFEWHRDKDFNHSENEINVFLPITKAYGTNTIWAESEEDKEDFTPIEASYGEMVIWKGSVLKHGNQMNDTGQTRVSFDFRIIRLSDYDEYSAQKSITTATVFTRGEYFDEKAV